MWLTTQFNTDVDVGKQDKCTKSWNTIAINNQVDVNKNKAYSFLIIGMSQAGHLST